MTEAPVELATEALGGEVLDKLVAKTQDRLVALEPVTVVLRARGSGVVSPRPIALWGRAGARSVEKSTGKRP